MKGFYPTIAIVINFSLVTIADEGMRLPEGNIRAGFFSHEDNRKNQKILRVQREKVGLRKRQGSDLAGGATLYIIY